MVKEFPFELVSDFITCLADDLDKASEMLNDNPDLVEARCSFGDSVLQYAASEAEFEAVQFLVERGADVNKPDKYGFTPLLEAAKIGSERIARILLENGASPNTLSTDLSTPLFCAITAGSAPLVELLLQYGADPAYISPAGKTIFDVLPRTTNSRYAIFQVLERHQARQQLVCR